MLSLTFEIHVSSRIGERYEKRSENHPSQIAMFICMTLVGCKMPRSYRFERLEKTIAQDKRLFFTFCSFFLFWGFTLI
jgi:hypothetical protein